MSATRIIWIRLKTDASTISATKPVSMAGRPMTTSPSPAQPKMP